MLAERGRQGTSSISSEFPWNEPGEHSFYGLERLFADLRGWKEREVHLILHKRMESNKIENSECHVSMGRKLLSL